MRSKTDTKTADTASSQIRAKKLTQSEATALVLRDHKQMLRRLADK